MHILTFILSMNSNCLNCENALREEDEYCSACGQAVDHEETLKSFLSHFLSDYFTFDSKIIRSIKPLITEPGFLSNEYLAGRRVRYIPPLRMFIFLSIIFFLLLSLLSNTTANDVGAEVLSDAFFERFFSSRLPKLFFVLLPLFAMSTALLFGKKNGSILPHFLFALHFHASIFLFGIIYTLISYVFESLSWIGANQVLLILIGVYIIYYLFKALKVVFKQSLWRTTWKLILLGFIYSLLLVCSSLLLLVLSINY